MHNNVYTHVYYAHRMQLSSAQSLTCEVVMRCSREGGRVGGG